MSAIAALIPVVLLVLVVIWLWPKFRRLSGVDESLGRMDVIVERLDAIHQELRQIRESLQRDR